MAGSSTMPVFFIFVQCALDFIVVVQFLFVAYGTSDRAQLLEHCHLLDVICRPVGETARRTLS